ncbi:MAG: hypothetical protein DSM106950_34760 [Stigonema ocellatum SAG 48.90 = DSM 106950]|nr:hypothetical protein [Stigonema ocellatum SAG 48.90 = DSM 106950]
MHKLLPPRQLRIPLLGSLLIIGGVFAYRAKPVLSNQMEYLRTLTTQVPDSQTYTWVQRNPGFDSGSIHKKVQLHKALKEAHIHKALSLKSGQKKAHLHKAIARSVPLQKSSLNANNQQQTYTWLQRNSPAPVVAKAQTSTTEVKIAARANFPEQNGVYLYGQSPKPDQLGQGYIVFEKQQGKVVGALYIPGSEYSCFNGTLYPSGELAMTVKGYPGEASPTQVATNNTVPRLNDDEPTTYAHSVTLQEYHRINSVSAQNRQILQGCKANLRE